MTWDVERSTGSAGAFHDREVGAPTHRSVWVFEVSRPALVLGSAQPPSVADADACAAAGVEVARRRSGGGAVLLIPDEVVWVDLILPARDPLWTDDVGRAMWWVGEAWAGALDACGVSGVTVHRGPLVESPWSRLVCFAGLGAGEVTVGHRKIVGISQRRTRHAARFQCGVYLRWDGDALIRLLAEPRPRVGELDRLVQPAPTDAGRLVSALLAALPT